MRLSLPLTRDLQVDRLQGCSMAWRSEVARRLEFSDFFHGYSHGEDLEFSRRAAAFGTMIISAEARVQHHQDPAGRPNQLEWARMAIRNRYFIQRTTLSDWRLSDALRLFYASGLNSLFIAAGLVRQHRIPEALQHLLGCLLGCADLMLKPLAVAPRA